MKVKSKLLVACLAVALVITFGVTANAQAQCCFGNIVAAPFYAATAIVGGAASLVAGIVTYPFTACGCHLDLCSTCVPLPAVCCPG